MAKKRDRYHTLTSLNSAEKAADGLNSAIESSGHSDDIEIVDEKLLEKKSTKEAEAPEEPEQEMAHVSDEIHKAPLLEEVSKRDTVRLLILTRDTSITTAGSAAQKRAIELADMFAEVHIIVLSLHNSGIEETARITNNVWLYATNSRLWWKTMFDAYRIANEQLIFTQGFRPDVILADDPFESGMVAYHLSEKHNRPFQIHIREDFYNPSFRDEEKHNDLRLLMAWFTLKRVQCIRTKSEFIKERVVAKYPNLEPYTETLPIYHNLQAWKDAVPTINLHELYPQFKFCILTASSLTKESHTINIITGVARTLKQYPTVGLVIVGNGPERKALERQATQLGLHDQVMFESGTHDVMSYMKTANVIVNISENVEDEQLILEAAVSGVPMIVGVSGLSGELFLDGESAFVCHNDSPPCIGEKINQLLNQNALRFKLAKNAEEAVFSRIEQDYDAYIRAYRDSIELCLVSDG